MFFNSIKIGIKLNYGNGDSGIEMILLKRTNLLQLKKYNTRRRTRLLSSLIDMSLGACALPLAHHNSLFLFLFEFCCCECFSC